MQGEKEGNGFPVGQVHEEGILSIPSSSWLRAGTGQPEAEHEQLPLVPPIPSLGFTLQNQ